MLLAYCYYQGDQNSMSNFFQEKLFFAKLQFLFNFFFTTQVETCESHVAGKYKQLQC